MNIDLDVQYAVSDVDDGEPPSPELIQTWVNAALAGRCEEAELTVRLVDRQEIQTLNQTYRDKNSPTNVLSFPFDAPEGVDLNLLGDVVICAPVVVEEAQQQSKDVLSHWAHMVIHGALHLLGYDHIDDDEAEIMESLEIEILQGLGIADPYIETCLTDVNNMRQN